MTLDLTQLRALYEAASDLPSTAWYVEYDKWRVAVWDAFPALLDAANRDQQRYHWIGLYGVVLDEFGIGSHHELRRALQARDRLAAQVEQLKTASDETSP